MNDELDHPPTVREPEPARGVAGPILFGAIVLALASFLAYRWLRPSAPPAPPVANAAPAAGQVPADSPTLPAVSAAVPAGFPPLPELDASDGVVSELLRALARDATWWEWVEADALVRRFAAGVLAVADGRLPKPILERMPVRGAFRVRAQGDRLVIDEASFARHDGALAALEAIDLEAAARLWRWVRPLVEAAWGEIAPPEAELSDSLLRGLDHLLATPTPPERIEVEAADGSYRFADPALEALTPVQKLLLRLGPARGERLRTWLRSVRSIV
jgi:hypothetical protein